MIVDVGPSAGCGIVSGMAAIAPALADRARRIRSVRTGPAVEGRRRSELVADDWKPARLIEQPATEVRDQGRDSTEERAALVVSDFDVVATDTYEVRSRSAGDGTWRVTGAAQVVITRRMGRVSIVPVRRLVEGHSSGDTG